MPLCFSYARLLSPQPLPPHLRFRVCYAAEEDALHAAYAAAALLMPLLMFRRRADADFTPRADYAGYELRLPSRLRCFIFAATSFAAATRYAATFSIRRACRHATITCDTLFLLISPPVYT